MLLWLLFFRRHLNALERSTVFYIVMGKVGTCQPGFQNRQWLSLWVHMYLPVVIWWRKNVCLGEKRSKLTLQEYPGKLQRREGVRINDHFYNLLTPRSSLTHFLSRSNHHHQFGMCLVPPNTYIPNVFWLSSFRSH